MAIMSCWTQRGCDEEMSGRCPHVSAEVYSPCPADCNYSFCSNPQHIIATDVSLLLDSEIDRTAAIKEQCYYCEFFLTNGPKIDKSVHHD